MRNKKLLWASVIFFIAYVVGTYTYEIIADIASPIYCFLAGIIILKSLPGKNKLSWFIVALIPLTWGFTDLLWLIVDYVFSNDPNEMTSFMFLYAIPNMCLAIAALIYFKNNLTKWNRFQLILDGLMVTTIVLGMFSAMFFEGLSYISYDFLDLLSIFIYAFTDIITLTVILVMFASTRLRRMPKSIMIASIGYLLYIFSDVTYVDEFFNGTYIPNSITDISFLFSFLIMAIASLHVIPLIDNNLDDLRPGNLGKSRIVWFMIFTPIVFYILGRIKYTYLIVFGLVLFIYLLLSHYVQRSLLTEILYYKERELKDKLEKMVAERTRDLKASRDALEKRAITDTLTGLYNRDYFYIKCDEYIEDKVPFSIFYLDLDRFKIINDLHGHHMGDRVLEIVSHHLKSQIDDTCDLFRVGGDEFALVKRGISDDDLPRISREIVQIISKKMVIDEYVFNLDCSIGISRYPNDGDTSVELMKHADIAMYHAKSNQNVNKHVVISSHMIEQIHRRNLIEILLKNTNFDQEFQLFYQPQFEAKTKKLIGMEALIRWIHPTEGFISPSEFIPISEEIGLIVPISDWVFEKAMQQIKDWNTTYNKDLKMGVNLSPISLNSANFYTKLNDMIKKYGIQPENLDLEITEHSAMNSSTVMEEVFSTLTGIGVNISIDDFGTGYSSLSYLKRFDIDTLKIAKELIDNIVEDYDDRLIVKAIIMMADGIGLNTIAEGVETQEQLDILIDLNCGFIQGYFYGRPVNRNDFEKLYLKIE